MNKKILILALAVFSLFSFSTEAKACGEWCEGLYSSGFCSSTESCVYFEGYGTCESDPNCSPVDLCTGVTCPPNSDGSCNYYDDCDTSGSYPITYWTCNSATGYCESGSTYGTCSRNTDYTGCSPYTSYGPWSSCSQLYPSCSGSQARTVTNYYCLSGSCSSSTTTDTQSCTVADGTSCGSETYGSCQYSSTCDTTGDRARTTYSCLGGSCQQLSSTNYDDIACIRNTDGLVCTTISGQPGTCQSGSCIASTTVCTTNADCVSYAASCGNGALDATGPACVGGKCTEPCDSGAPTIWGVGWQCLNLREQYCNSDCSGWRTDYLGPCNQQCRADIIACNKAYPGTYCGPVGEEAAAVCDYNCNCVLAGSLILLSCTGNQLIQSSEYLTLSWTGVGEAYSYWVYYRSYLSSTYTSGWVFAPITTYVVSGLEAGAYSWYVEAYNEAGELIDIPNNPSQIGECGITDLTQTITASKTYAAIGETIGLTVSASVSSPRSMVALSVSDSSVPYDWRYCCCQAADCWFQTYYGSGESELCSSYGSQSCSNTWDVIASSSDLRSPVFRYSSGSYDAGPVGDTEYAPGGGTYGASVVVNQKECNIDADCAAQNNVRGKCDTTGAITGTPNTCYWAACGADTDCVSGASCYCGVCDLSFTSSGCPDGQCCNRGYGGSGIGECKIQGTIYNQKYLCDPPEWGGNVLQTEVENKSIFDSILNFFSQLFTQR